MKANPSVHVIKETRSLAIAIDRASLLWPELAGQRTQLLYKILEAGMREIERENEKFSNNRLNAIRELAGSMDNVWPENWREELSEGWPK
jgi:hypothetical protein